MVRTCDSALAGVVAEPGGAGPEVGQGRGHRRRPAPRVPNPCVGAEIRVEERPFPVYRVDLPFTPSTKALKAYQAYVKHKPVLDRRETPPKVTFDEKAVAQLMRRYPQDPLYPLLGDLREAQKIQGTYIEGLKPFLKPSGRVCGELAPKTLTLRLAQKAPSQLNLPRPDTPLRRLPRSVYIAGPGQVLRARDYTGIEARLVGYLANAPHYVRLTGIDAHSFLASHILGQGADLAWDDDRLRTYLKAIKHDHHAARQSAKKIQHAGNYGATAYKTYIEEPGLFRSPQHAQAMLDLYFALFPEIKHWQERTADICDSQGYITAPSGFRLYFTDVYAWTYVKAKTDPHTGQHTPGHWSKTFGEQAKEAFASVPQHLGACALMHAACTLCEEYPEFESMIRLLIHDELLWECPEAEEDLWDARVQEVMERPMPWLPVPASWGLGTHLNVTTEGKRGHVWSEMR